MTTYFPVKRTCAVCGKTHTYQEIGSTNCFGPSDLDLRPAPMQRWTMHAWVQTCPDCGYTAARVDEPTEADKEWLAGEVYRTCAGRRFASDLAADFYRCYMNAMREFREETAMLALVHAAWACDDEGDEEMAKMCRREAADLFGIVRCDSDNYLVLRADLLRRSGQFDKLIEIYKDIHSENEMVEKILRFEEQRAEAHDTRRYTVANVMPDD